MSQGEGLYPAPTRKRIEDLDAQISAVQKGTRALVPAIIPLHDILRQKFRWYYKWTAWPASKIVNIAVLFIYIIGASLFGMNYLSHPNQVLAATTAKTWVDGTSCNGDGNWNTAGNWSPSGVPTNTSDVSLSSTYDCPLTIDAAATAASFTVNSGYSQNITANYALTTDSSQGGNGSFVLNGGTYLANATTLTIVGSFTVDTGTFTAGTSTVVMKGTGTVSTGTQALNNLKISASSSSSTAPLVYLTSSQTYSLPTTGSYPWNSGAYTVEAIGAGGKGLSTAPGYGGAGGGAYAINPSVTAGSGITVTVPVNAAGDTSYGSYVIAKGGSSASGQTGGIGGAAASCTPTTGAYSGGAGGTGGGTGGKGVGGGGGAAGAHGAGGKGGNGSTSGGFDGGGGGADGGTAGSNGLSAAGAAGVGANGGGNGGSVSVGLKGTEWDSTHGSGGGASGLYNGGNYGGGGSRNGGNVNYGGPGLVAITYQYNSVVNSTITTAGNVVVAGTLTTDSGQTLSIATSNTVTMNANATTTINGTISGAGTLSLTDTAGANLSTTGTLSSSVLFNMATAGVTLPARTYAGAVTINNSTASNYNATPASGTLTFSSSFATTTSSTGTLTFLASSNNPTLKFGGSFTLSNQTTYTKGSGTTTFNGTTTYTDSNSMAQNIGPVTVNGTSLALASNMKVDTMTITAGNLNLGANGYTFTLANAGSTATVLTVTGTLTIGNSNIVYAATNSGGNVTVNNLAYSSLELAGAQTYALAGNETGTYAITGNIKIDSGATLTTTASNFNITLSGNWTNNGTFIPGTSTLTLAGAAAESFTAGGTSVAFQPYNLAITNTSTAGVTFADSLTLASGGTFSDAPGATSTSKLTFNPSSTYTFPNITLTGHAGYLVTLTGSSAWNFVVSQATPTAAYVAVDYSDATGSSSTISCPTGCTDNGNNINWDFGVVPSVPTAVGTNSVTSAGFNATWTDNSSNETGFKVYKSTAVANNNCQDAGTAYTLYATAAANATTQAISGLSANTQYCVYITSTNATGDSSAAYLASPIYTNANTPTAPTVNATSATSLTVIVNQNSNPAGTQFAIQETQQTGGQYVQTDGNFGASPVWQTYSQWGGASGILTNGGTGLLINTQYTFQVEAENANNVTTSFSPAAQKYTLAQTPLAPTVSNLPGANQVSSENVVVNSNGNSASTPFAIYEVSTGKYVQYTTNPGTLGTSADWQTLVAWGDVSGTNVTGLTANTNYTFEVKAENSDLTPVETAMSSGSAKYTYIETPTNVTIGTVGMTGIAMTAGGSFTNLAVGSSGLQFMETSGNSGGGGQTGFSDATPPNNWTQSNSVLDSGLTANTTYSYNVKARNGDGTETSFTSPDVSQATSATVNVAAPTGVTLTPNSTTQETTTWTDNSSNETGFKVFISTTPNADCSAATYPGSPNYTTAANATSQIVTGLTFNTQYCAEVIATDAIEDSIPAYSLPKYTLVNTPGTPTVTAVSASSENVVINQNSNPAGTQYAIYETNTSKYVQSDGSLNTNAAWQDYTTWGSASGVNTIGLNPNTQYNFQTKARNTDNAETTPSTGAAKYTFANTPATPTLNSATTSSINVVINQNGNPAGSAPAGDTNYAFGIDNDADGVVDANGWVQANGALGASAVWNTYSGWGATGKVVTGFSSNTSYTFMVKAKNGDNAETALSPSATLSTLSNPNISGTSNQTSGTVALALNGTLQSGKTATIQSDGTWAINDVVVTNGQVVTVWINGVADALESTGVTKYDGAGDITGLVLNTNVLTLGSGDNQSLTAANVGAYNNTNDEDVILSWSSSNLNADLPAYTDPTINILSGTTLTIGATETLTSDNIAVAGTLTASGAATFTIAGNWTQSGTFTAGTKDFTIAGNYSQDGGTFTSGANSLTVTGTFTQTNGTFNAPSGTWTVSNTFTRSGGTFNANNGTVVFSPTVSFTVTTGGLTFNNLTFFKNNNTSYTITLNDGFNVAGIFTINTIGINGFSVTGSVPLTINVTGDLSLIGSGGSGFGNNITVNLSGNFNMSNGTLSANINLVNTEADQTITQTSGTILSGAWTVNKAAYSVIQQTSFGIMIAGTGSVTTTSGKWYTNGQNLTVKTLNNNSTLKINGNETLTITTRDTTHGTVEYAGTGTYTSLIYGNTYKNLLISGAGSFTAAAATTLTGDFTQTAGTFVAPSTTLTLSGNFNNTAGLFTHNSGGVVLNGTDQAVNGDTTFYNLTKTTSTSRTLTFEKGKTQTIANSVNFAGAAGQLLKLYSSDQVTPAQWIVSMPATQTLNYLSVKDSDNSTGVTAVAASSTDEGNNLNWIFGIPLAPTIGTPQAISTNAIRWTFTDNTSNETGFKVYDGSNNLVATCATPNLTYCDETGLSTNTQYSGRYVVAYNAAGDSNHSATAASIYTLIETPTGITFNTVTATSISMHSTNTPSNLGVGQSKLVFTLISPLYSCNTTGTSTSCTFNGLSVNTQYSFKVHTLNGDGTPTADTAVSSKYTLTNTPTAPSVTASYDTTNNYSTTLTINTNSNPSNTQYHITSGTSAGAINNTVQDWATHANGDTLSQNNLLCGQEYYYGIESKNGDGVVSSKSTNFATTPPCAPSGLQDASTTANSTILTWNSAGIATYDFSFGTDQSATSLGQTNTISSTQLPVSSLNASTTYFYKVRTTNTYGTGAWSLPVSFTTLEAESQLLMSLPGQNYIAGTGITGTPDHQIAGHLFNATVYAVSDTKALTSNSNELVTFSTVTDKLISSFNIGSSSPVAPQTLSNGQKTVSLKFFQAGLNVVNMTGSTGASSVFTVDAADTSPDNSTVNLDNSNLNTNQAATLSINLQDIYGNAAANRGVTVSSDQLGDIITYSSGQTDQNGLVYAYVTSGLAHTSTLTVTDQNGVILNTHPQITFKLACETSIDNPTNFVGSAGNSSTSISWQNPSTSYFDHADIYRSTISGQIGDVIHAVKSTDNPNNNYIDNGLTNDTKYYYTLKAVDNCSENNTSSGTYQLVLTPTDSKRTIVIDPPTNLRATAIGSTTISLSWDAPSYQPITGYKLYNATTGIQIDATLNPSYDLTGLTPNMDYQFDVTAFDGDGNVSVPSTVITIATSGSVCTVNCSPVKVTYLILGNVPESVLAGQPLGNKVRVLAADAGGAMITNYVGSVYFDSTDSKSKLQWNKSNPYVFTLNDAGVHEFDGSDFVLNTVGNQDLTVNNGVNSGKAIILVKSNNVVFAKAQDTINNFVGQNASKVNNAVVTTTTALLITPAAVNIAVGLGNILPQLIYWFTQLLQMVGIRKKRKPWGIIFNSQTGQPVSLAMVRIFDKEYNRMLESTVTDREGRFGFLVRPGTFYIVVAKSGFTFPSQYKVSGFFENVYSGGNLQIDKKDDGSINMNIPLDPQAKASAVFMLWAMLIKLNRYLQKARMPLMTIGVIFAIVMTIKAYNVIYVLSLMLYIFLFIIEFFNAKKSRPYGVVSDVFGHPLEISIVRIYSKKTDRLVATDVTDSQGRFKFLVNPGIYYMTAAKPGYIDFKSHIMYLERERTMVTANIKLKKVDNS